MGWPWQTQPALGASAVGLGLPRRVLRHLIVRHGFSVGTRVLDVGCGDGELVRSLYELGFDVMGIDESPTESEATSGMEPELDLRRGRADELAAGLPHKFDIVLVRGFSAYGGNLFSPQAFRATANLLSCVCPGRLLVFLVRTGQQAPQHPPAHSVSCYENHLAAFAGHVESTPLPDSYMQPGTWKSLMAGRPAAGYVAATLQVPWSPWSRTDWLRLAEAASKSHRGLCCRRSMGWHGVPTTLSAA